ncbi:MAG TPA: thioredoxin [Candidatus Omnitrophota bacterium]|nr:thioredoxin [Candidatus Omnitrophota bacterium]HPB68420.1 thioredoxin [Candidatus Omnitrophota bacterium]HQO57288.1 thioredoxin [Candidatus Omnitrophota bacterium]HQP11299.1 thioredoxin [Candidatus Omnitrophota bacterium]
MSVGKVTAGDFESEVLKSATPVLVDFWAEWCGPCKMIAPVLEDVAEELAGRLKVLKVNVDESQDLAGQFGIMSIPTLLLFKNGKVVKQLVGAMGKAQIVNKIEADL